jgi:hypothetical protein
MAHEVARILRFTAFLARQAGGADDCRHLWYPERRHLAIFPKHLDALLLSGALECVTIGVSRRHGRRLRPQLCNQLQNLPEHLPGNGDLGHLEGDLAAVAYNLRADLDHAEPPQ